MEGIFRKISHLLNGPEITIFHKFKKPPYGGGNQFLLALAKELKRQGHDVGDNTLGRKTKAVIFNSFEFDKRKLRLGKKYHTRMVQRLAGPIGVYRGTDIQIDKDIWELNKFADATIFISNYSFNKYKELGLDFINPHVILNACDPNIFYRKSNTSDIGDRKIRLIATAWSNNPKKGGQILSWLDEKLDHDRFELTFVGRTKATFKGAKLIEPVPSEELANILREHDIYIAPSEDDPCSNALIEALTCGLPAAYRISGGHPEIVKEGGEGWTDEESLIKAIEKIATNIESYRDKIQVNTIEQVTKKYLEVLMPELK